MELEDGPRTAGASGRGGDLRGRCAIAGLLRTAAGGLRRALYPLTWGSGTRRRRHDGPNRGMARGCSSSLAPRCWRHAGKGAALTCFVASTRARSADRAAAVADADSFLAGAGGDGARGWTSHRRGERPRRRPTGSLRDRRAVAHSGWGSQACSLSVDVGQRHAASPPRWPQPRHGKGVLELTRATLLAPRWKRGRVDLLCRLYARAKARKQGELINRPCLGFVYEEPHSQKDVYASAIGLCKDSIIMQSTKPSNSDFWRSFNM